VFPVGFDWGEHQDSLLDAHFLWTFCSELAKDEKHKGILAPLLLENSHALMSVDIKEDSSLVLSLILSSTWNTLKTHIRLKDKDNCLMAKQETHLIHVITMNIAGQDKWQVFLVLKPKTLDPPHDKSTNPSDSTLCQ
jgi:hypothetical protein